MSMKKRSFFTRFFQLVAGGLLLCGIFGGMVFVLIFVVFAHDLPRPETISNRITYQSSRIYDRTGGVLLYEFNAQVRREYVKIDDVSSYFKWAIIAAEDKNFYSHMGVDAFAIMRALAQNISKKDIRGGASTISQQFVRNSLLSRERTVTRKIREVILTLELERRYPKDYILELYINQIPFGSNIYGVETASRAYFKKPSRDLTLGEAALLAGLPRSPSLLSPAKQEREGLFRRQRHILHRMKTLKFISQEEYNTALEEPIQFHGIAQPIKAPHFVMYVKSIIEKNYGPELLERGGISVITTINWGFQEKAELLIKNYEPSLQSAGASNAALVALDPRSGEILAMVGSKDFFNESIDGQVNVTLMPRQPGSAFKPFVYALAFERGYVPETIVIDELTDFGTPSAPYVPHNFDERFRGPVTLRQSLAQSLNVPSVKVLQFVGVPEAIEYAKKFGISTLRDPSRYGLSLVLGGAEVTLLELSGGYGVFATGGYRVPPTPIKEVRTMYGDTLFSHNVKGQRIISPSIAETINSILSDNQARAPIFGTSSSLLIAGVNAAVKTGTTQDFRDAWTVGYVPNVVVGVWIGNNNNDPMYKSPGAMIAAPLWNRFMREALKNTP